jgi:hypothetical protein
MQLRKKGLPVVSLEETLESDEEAPRKEFGANDVKLSGSVDRCSCSGPSIACRRVTKRFLCSTMWRVLSITKLPNL